MTRYVVAVKEEGKPQWIGMVEANGPLEAAYQYPGYRLVFKQEFFFAEHKNVQCIATNWGDVVFVESVDQLTADFLSCDDSNDGNGG